MSTFRTCRVLAFLAAALVVLWQCGATPPEDATAETGEPAPSQLPARSTGSPAESSAAWNTIYAVLQHPRCSNCHPAGDAPLQGDAGLPHGQNVQRGTDGTGRYAMRCSGCHQNSNPPLPNLPPGAPHWQLPRPEMPLQFVGRGSRELCDQLRDPARNGGKTPEQLITHMASDPLVLWGWNPGPGRTPVSTSHEALVRAMRTWVDGGCSCPDR
jgi:cytochrome c5